MVGGVPVRCRHEASKPKPSKGAERLIKAGSRFEIGKNNTRSHAPETWVVTTWKVECL